MNIVTIPMLFQIPDTGRYVFTTTVPPDMQLVGGGYHILHQDPVYNVHDVMATQIEANYPSSESTWTVILYQRDSPKIHATNTAINLYALVEAYCVSSKVVHLAMVIDSSAETRTFGEEVDQNCPCPPGAVVMAGGFRAIPTMNPPAAYGLWATAPALDNSTMRAVGWKTRYSEIPHPSDPALGPTSVKTFVLSSTARTQSFLQWVSGQPGKPVLTDRKPIMEKAPPTGLGINFTDREVLCDTDCFTTGGGFDLHQEGSFAALTIHGNWKNLAGSSVKKFRGWSAGSFTSVDNKFPLNSMSTDLWTLNIETPKVVTVNIISPHSADCVTPSEADPNISNAILFKADALDIDGNHLGGSSVEWKINGHPFGYGAFPGFTKPIDVGWSVPMNSQSVFKVTVTASGKGGESASASVILVYCPIIK